MNSRTCLLILLVAVAGIATAQEARLDGPVSGLVYDEHAHAIRIIVGLPGSAYLGDSVVAGLDFATVAPNGKLALTLQDGRLSLLRLEAETRAETLAENYPTPTLASWLPDSSAIALYGAEAGIAVWRKLEATPEPAHLGNPASLGRLSALALEAGSRSAAFVIGADAIFRGTEASDPILLARGSEISGIAVGNGEVYFADRAAQTVSVIRGAAGTSEVVLLANEALGVRDPAGLALIANELTVASAAQRELIRLNPSTGELLGRTALAFAPDRVALLTNAALPLYELQSRAGASAPLQLLDAAHGAVFFVPVPLRRSGDAELPMAARQSLR